VSAHSFEGCQVLLYRFRLAAPSCPDFSQEPPARRSCTRRGAGDPRMESNWGVLVAKEQLTGLACLPATRCAMASATSHPSSSSARAGAGRSRQMIWARVILSTNDGGRCLACSRKSSTRVRSNSTQPYVHAHNLVMVPHPPPFVKLTHCPHAVFPLLLAPLLTSHILLPASQYTTDHSALPTSPFTYSLHSSTAPAAPRRASRAPAPSPSQIYHTFFVAKLEHGSHAARPGRRRRGCGAGGADL